MDNKITYRKVGDFYLPNLAFPKSKYSDYNLGKYGRMRARYLKEHKKAEYAILLIDGKLDEHLYNTDIECKNRFELLMKQFAKREHITEELKAKNQMEWVHKMNTIKNAVEEIIFEELIFV
ncbi:MAG TPA: TnpV protein [Clostridiales bacterium]|nr:TnpV protein [Clostridiales bacterium]